jgi:hypothetical protein
MRNQVFCYKENNTNDRDCVKYIELDRLGKLECGHYFPSINLIGANFSMGFDFEELKELDITSILNLDELKKLDEYNNLINELGYSITEGDERYNKGLQYFEEIKPIIEKLKSEDNQKLFERVVQEEIEFLKEEYNFDDEDIENIFDNIPYNLYYKDRGIVGTTYSDVEELATEEAFQLGITDNNSIVSQYFDYERFGNDLLQEQEYLELKDGRVVRYSY